MGGAGEEEEEHHQNPFLCNNLHKPSFSKLQFRNEVSRARWDGEMGMSEIIEKKGGMWTTTGVIRNGKLYCHVEEILFLAERGALLLLGADGTILSIRDIYKKIAEGNNGCSWESFEAYKHLKSLGYIVGRHGLPWTMKNNKNCYNSNSLEGTVENDGGSDGEVNENMSIIQLFKDMQISAVKPTFDVYLPNSKFRKSSPGNPSFLLCLQRDTPPSRVEVENLEKICEGVPLKFCFVDHGRGWLCLTVRGGEGGDGKEEREEGVLIDVEGQAYKREIAMCRAHAKLLVRKKGNG